MTDPQKILEYYQARQGHILRSIGEIVDLESPSRASQASRRVVKWVEEQAQSTGTDLSIETIPADDGEHIVIRTFPGEGPQTLLLGHTDTVHPAGTREQNPTRVEDGRFYGCGIFDMKANIVLAIETLRFFARNDMTPAGAVTLLLSCDEEVGSHSGRPIVEREAAAADRCLVLEPSAGGKAKTGRKGTGMYTLRAHGVPAHAGLEPEKGANAIVELSRHIDEIHEIADPAKGTTVNVTTIKGGTTSNVIPEFAECQIDARFSAMAEGERVDSSLRSIKAIDDRVSLELDGAVNRPPLERTPAVVVLFEKARVIAAGFGYDLGETQVGGASDGNFVGALGVPVLDGLGVAGAGAHTLDEYILVSDIAPRATLLTLLLSVG
jgi:glutamate carboxypeptidase